MASISSPSSSSALDREVDPTDQFVAAYQSFETSLRNLFGAGGRLAEAATLAQAAQRLSPTGGHQVFAAISRSNLAITEALGHIAGGHRVLETLGKSLGIDVSAYGDKHPQPSETHGLLLPTV